MDESMLAHPNSPHRSYSKAFQIPRRLVLPQQIGLNSTPQYASITSTGLGQPQAKPLFSKIDIVATATSLVCLICAICATTPRLTLCWKLGFGTQIVVIGFLLGIMNLCTQTVLPTTLLVLEIRFGPARLQNYDAIMTGKFLSPHTNVVWRTVLVSMLALPLGLGVAYKRLLGGVGFAYIKPPADLDATYGLTYPSLGDSNSMNNSVFELFNCNAGFFSVAWNDSLAPNILKYPVPLGYNMLLLQEDAAALLDLQSSQHLGWIRSQLRPNETWQITATVNATVARQNKTLAQIMQEDDSSFASAFTWIDSFWLFYESMSLSMMTLAGGQACMIGTQKSSYFNAVRLGYPYDGEDVEDFRQSALVFNLSREVCTGIWNITKETVNLVGGDCKQMSTAYLSQNMISTYPPFTLDTLPVLVHSIGRFASTYQNSPWQLPAYASSVASSWWARAVFMLTPGQGDGLHWPDLFYPAENEIIISMIPTLNASWLLYLVLSIHPIITISAILVTATFYSTPMGNGFGLISILAGIDASRLHLLHGAAFSGNLAQPVNLGFRFIEQAELVGPEHDEPTRPNLTLRYSLLQRSEAGEMIGLKRKELYQ